MKQELYILNLKNMHQSRCIARFRSCLQLKVKARVRRQGLYDV